MLIFKTTFHLKISLFSPLKSDLCETFSKHLLNHRFLKFNHLKIICILYFAIYGTFVSQKIYLVCVCVHVYVLVWVSLWACNMNLIYIQYIYMYYLEINVQKCHIQIKSLKCLDLLRILFKKIIFPLISH